MDIKDLKSLIKTNSIPNLLIFNVENSYLCRQYIESMASTLNKAYKFYDTADEVLYEVTTNLREDFIYIVFCDSNVVKKDAYIHELQKLNRNVIIYLFNIDKQSNFYKNNSSIIVNFPQIDKYSIVAYLMNKLKSNKIEIDESNVEKLVDYCNCDYGCCINELDKIISLDQPNSNLVMDYMLSNGFSDYRKVNIFNFINKLFNKNMDVFEDVVKVEEPTIYVLNLVYRTARKKLLESNNYKYARIMQTCINIDSGIKDGTFSDKYALQYLILKVFNDK